MTLPRIGVSALALFEALLPIALACTAMAIAVLASQAIIPIKMPLLGLAFNAALGAFVYGATFWLFYRGIVRETWALMRDRNANPDPA